ncbi:LEVG family PEP-CTERM protein [Anabaena cylindrica FACHB-243]|nr:LEVG family PEP-CTERM protein [Anabaena cylindrica]MBD2419091.1 LEVG family PEP-CTERM protein [Anabaena cylindrica FACHB-243]MBY5310307.1 PEP-CTERM sorting domain-containing protein [Anabaena sp. CCAP 1446/1C]
MKSFKSLVTTVAVSTLGLSLLGGLSEAQAASLVPQSEEEVTFGVPNSFGYTITSIDYDGAGGNLASRLFIDNRLTVDTYPGPINFKKTDGGTNPDGFWFRPVAVAGDGTPLEKGQLEVGKFNFNFGAIGKTIKLNIFDVEDIGTLIDNIVGGVNPASIAIVPGANSNIQSVILKNVKSFDIKLGLIGGTKFPTTGDGARLEIETVPVPEPTTILGLGALGMAGAFGLRKSKKASSVA